MKGSIKVFISGEPIIVFVLGFSSNLNLWVCEKLNSGDTYFCKEIDLIDLDFIKFKELFYKWKIDNCDKIKERYIQLLNEK